MGADVDPCQKKQAILAYNSRCQCLVAAFLQNTMPWTADQKRKRRAEQAGAVGKRYKPRKHPCIRELQLPALEATPPPPVEQNQQSNLTVQEEMERARMEVEDCRVRMQGVMQASASLVSFYQTWLQPGQEVYLRPHYAHVLQLGKKEATYKHKLVNCDRDGRWRLSVVEGPRKGKELCINVPPEALMP